jgi:putative hydrolase of the HAD superfamily
VTWVLFDYGGVISYPPADEDLALLAAAAGAPVPVLMDVYWAWRRAYDLAELDAPGYWREVGRALGRGYGEAEIAELIRIDQAAWLRLRAEMVGLIEDLAAAGQPLALLSNAPRELAEAITELPVASYFGQLIFSCQLKLAKPDPECYARTLDLLGARASEVIFVDDRDVNVAAAVAFGLQAVPFTSASEVRAAVTERLAVGG